MSDHPDFPVFDEPTFYEVLEVDPGASEEEVRQAHKRAQEVYSRDSMVVYTLFSDEELETLQRQLALAYDTIIDPRKRRQYDVSRLGGAPQASRSLSQSGTSSSAPDEPAERSSRPRTPAPVSSSLPPGLEIDRETVFTGDVLKQIREHKGVDLRDVSNRTKISVMNLRMMEEMRFDRLQAPVYVRGFLREYARHLRLPIQQVVDTYMAVFTEHLGEPREQR